MFEIPPAPHGLPMSWQGHWYGRDGESIGALNQSKLDAIKAKGVPDWTAGIIQEASMADLDSVAILAARVGFKRKNANSHLAMECDDWDDGTFLGKAKLTRSGKIARATLLLLGKKEAAHWLSPADARMSWILKGPGDTDVDYQPFEPPFLLNTEALYNKIKNITYRIMPSGKLFPVELLKYDTWVMREVLHNCIAHQDYTMHGRINVIEHEESLTLTNLAGFIPESVDRVLESGFAPDRYRNPFLADAMVQINMIDTVGSGIRRMFRKQRERGFPLPDYDLSNPNKVIVSIYGKVIDENYTRALLSEPDLNLDDVMALDKVQKRKALTEAELKSLKQKKLIEGRRPNFYVSARVAAATGSEVEHVLNSGIEDSHYKGLVLTLIRKFGPATPEQINKMLLVKLPAILNEQQKKAKIHNLMQEMSKKDGSIQNVGKHGRGARWDIAG